MGIHQGPQPSESVFSKVAHRIKWENLDADDRFDLSPLMVTKVEPSSSPWWMAVLPRTALMFNILAAYLRSTILYSPLALFLLSTVQPQVEARWLFSMRSTAFKDNRCSMFYKSRPAWSHKIHNPHPWHHTHPQAQARFLPSHCHLQLH